MFVLHPSKYARGHVQRFSFYGLVWAFLQSTPETTFKVFDFRDWFGVSCLYCTLQSTLETTFRVFNFRDWFGGEVVQLTTLFKIPQRNSKYDNQTHLTLTATQIATSNSYSDCYF